MLKIAVLISGNGSNLQAIIDACKDHMINAEVVVVISNKVDAFGLQRAKREYIAAHCIDHRHYQKREDFDQAMSKVIDVYQANLVVLAGFMRILSAEFVDRYQQKLINIHPSLLPSYPGTDTHARVLAAGDTWHGATVHYVITEVDAGPIIVQGRLAVRTTDSAKTLQQRIHLIEHKIYPQAVTWIANNQLSVVNDQVLLDNEIESMRLQTFDH